MSQATPLPVPEKVPSQFFPRHFHSPRVQGLRRTSQSGARASPVQAAHRRTMQSPRHAHSLRAHHMKGGAHQEIHKSSTNKYKSYEMKFQQVHELESPRARV